MDILARVTEYIQGFGAAVFLPVILFLLGLIVGLKPGRAFRSGIMMGVAFTGMILVISGLFYAQIAPAATAMVERTGLHLDMLDIGWTPASAIAVAWPAAAVMVLLQIAINLVMLGVKATSTLNVDIWNVWVKAYLGGLTVLITGSFPLAILFAAVMVIIELKLADWTAYMVQEYVNVPGVAVPHSNVLGLLVAAPINAILDKIPGINRVKADTGALRERFGIFGESMTLGLIIGLAIGILAGYDLQKILTLAITAATALVLMPRIAVMFGEALAPLSEAAGAFMKRRFPGREFFIGLDWPILAGNPATYAVGILAIPFVILLSVILPGNRVLVFGGIADWAWMVSMIGVMAGGNLIRMMIISVVVAIPAYLYTATFFGDAITRFAQQVSFQIPESASSITWFGTSPLNLILMKIGELNFMSIAWFVGLVALVWFARFYLMKLNKEAKLHLDAAAGEAAAGPA
jgi:PTS system galactitol-specific IIC component